MPIMSYDEWKRRTSVGLKPRSKPLKYLDACLKEYDKNRGSRAHFDQLVIGYQAWAETKGDAEGSERNRQGAVTDLLSQITDFRDQHMPFAHRGGQPARPAALLRDIKQGARLLSEGKLRPQVKVQIPIGVTDSTKGKVTWEEFEDSQLVKARQGWADAYECARLAVAGIGAVGRNPAEEQRFQRWFGRPTSQAVSTVRSGLEKMWTTFQSSPVTIVLREDITVHLVNGDDPFDAMEEGFSGSGVYGYVWNHGAGSGFRIIMGKWFLSDPDPIEGAAQTIYHELTHKVLKTKDHAYGKIKCRGFSAAQQDKALTNADNWAFYAVSFKKEI
jgi:hypothetical protein